MPVSELRELTWEEVRGLDASAAVVILPIGAIEAHGPHLPLETDVIIADAMARAAAGKLAADGCQVLLLPPLSYTSAAFAEAFPGTISVRPDTFSALLRDIAEGVAGHGLETLAIANAHLDPGHLASIARAVEHIEASSDLRVVFPDLTQKPWAGRLTDEFKSGACHAGQYETSVVMATRPEAVREAQRVDLEDNPASLSEAIRAGHDTFAAAGGPRAYFGYPARATAAEGLATIETLGSILAEAVAEAFENTATT